jgi:hypothetical protein
MRHEGKPPARSNGGAGYIGSQIGIERMIVKTGPTAGARIAMDPLYNDKLYLKMIFWQERSQNGQSFQWPAEPSRHLRSAAGSRSGH